MFRRPYADRPSCKNAAHASFPLDHRLQCESCAHSAIVTPQGEAAFAGVIRVPVRESVLCLFLELKSASPAVENCLMRAVLLDGQSGSGYVGSIPDVNGLVVGPEDS